MNRLFTSQGSDRPWRLLVALTGLAFIVRVVNFAGQPFLGWDDAIFGVLGKHLVLTGRFDFTWGRPLHVALLGLAYWVLGVRADVGALVSIFFGVLAVPLTYQLGRRIFSPAAGLASAALLAGSYFHVWWSRWLQSQAGELFFLALAALVYAQSLSADGGRPRRWLLAGFLLAAAYTLHYSVFMQLPVWVAFEAYAGFRLGWRWRVRAWRAIGLAAGAGALLGLFAFVLMPPETPLWYKLAGWYPWRSLARGCCYLNEMVTPFYDDGLGFGVAGDWGYYFRTVAAMEGYTGLALLLGGWAYGLGSLVPKQPFTGRLSPASLRRQWILWLGLAGFGVLVVASTLGSAAAPKIAALVVGPNALLAGVALVAVWQHRPAWTSGRAARAALAAGYLVVVAWRLWPLMTVVTPYDALARSLEEQRAGRPVVGLFSGSLLKPFVWRFYLDDKFLLAETGPEVAGRCREADPALLLKSSDTQLPDEAAALPLLAEYPDATSKLRATHYVEGSDRRYFSGAYLPGAAVSLQVYDLRGCPLEYNNSP